MEGIFLIYISCRLYLRLYFVDSDSNILCSSGSVDVFVVNDVADNLPVIHSILVVSDNLPVSLFVSSALIKYSSASHSLYFTLDELGIRHVLFSCFLDSRYSQSSNHSSSV